MDVFGHFIIKDGRKELKHWGLIFTCLASRVIHLETLNALPTDSFINALRRFISCRGKVRELRSDQGTNFIGAKKELSAALRELNRESINQFLSLQDCDWIEFNLNVPHASHMGGVWERQIRTTRSVLSSLLREHGAQLDNESLRTLMTEADNIVNSRPLTVDNLTDRLAAAPLTPSHILTQKTQIVLPLPGKFDPPGHVLTQEMASSPVPRQSVLAALTKGILCPPTVPTEMEQPTAKLGRRRRSSHVRRDTQKQVATRPGH